MQKLAGFKKIRTRNFSVLTALEVETNYQQFVELQTAAGQTARVKIIQMNKKYAFAVLFAKCLSWVKKSPSIL
jgi:hypothetical protein